MTTKVTYTSGALDPEVDAAFDAELERQRGNASETLGHLIDGKRISSGAILERRDPSDITRRASAAHTADATMIGTALNVVRGGARDWAARSYEERCQVVEKAIPLIEDRRMELAATISLETGKTRTESLAEVEEGIDIIKVYVREMRDNNGYTRPLDTLGPTEKTIDLMRPYGVFGVIAPFNFPFALAMNMALAAILAGNTVVLKPSEEAPFSGDAAAQVLIDGGLPTNVLAITHGSTETGQAIVASPVDGIAFTGSVPVGQEIARAMQGGPFARPAVMEMGGKNPTVVTTNADPKVAAEGVARAAFGLSGQKCSACSRAIVIGDQVDEFAEALKGWAEKFTVGDPADHDSFLGPVINAESARRFELACEESRRDGKIIAGGVRPDLPGHFVAPTVVTDLPLGHRLTREELFLPFVAVTRVNSFEEAMDEANATPYGLTAGVFSEDEDEVAEFLERIEAGITYINRQAGSTTGAWPGVQSFCGWKASGSTGKGGLGPHYLPQFMREQSRTYLESA